MLQRIQIRDLAIIDNLELELATGMTVITGETGAGKSIVIDALDIALGERIDSKIVRASAERCEVILEFDITQTPAAENFLRETDLYAGESCLIRRIINASDGRSRNYVNGTLVTLQQLRELGSHLVHVHGQHEHRSLVKRDEQRELLDLYAGHTDLLLDVKTHYLKWRDIQKAIQELLALQDKEAEITLLSYQVEELEHVQLIPQESEQLHLEHRELANAEQLLEQSRQVLSLLSDDETSNISTLTNHATTLLSQMKDLSPKLENACQLLANALIEITEAENEVREFALQIELNPARLQEIDTRLNQLHQLARKHKISVEELPDYFLELKNKLDNLTHSQTKLASLHHEEQEALVKYHITADKLHKNRVDAAKRLNQQVTANMQILGMTGGEFCISINKQTNALPTAHGTDKVEFLVKTNPGQTLQPMANIASGGELSRISLAIQVITAQAVDTPTLVFDEVDVGIGGGIAEIVGKLLRRLGAHAQILCITHLPQVAAQGHHHLRIHKETQKGETRSHVTSLTPDLRIEELARMLGGIKITQQSLAHAKEMLDSATLVE
ncbi:MAG: DNA repair protein RecN [Legionellales bacterium]|nr:DNA repair protein RecN [Legionellales bacterium]